jgi:Fe-S cluster assembly ATP-binding protein
MVIACLKKPGDVEIVEQLAEKTNLTDFLDRDINHGFSGGEIKRSELLQLLAQAPELSLLDEPESGVDLENIALIGQLINDLLGKIHPMHKRTLSGLIISHTGHILNYVNARTGYVMCNGRIICEGDPHDILNTIKEKGYQECVSCIRR